MSTIRPPIALAAVVMAAALLAGCNRESEDKLLQSAQEYIAKKDYKSAAIQLKSLLQRNTNSAVGRYTLGKTLLDSGDATGALVELRKARELGHPDDKVVPDLARAMLLGGEHAAVLTQFGSTVLTAAPAQADLLTSVSIAQAMAGQADKAKEAITRALQAYPQHVPAIVVQARVKAGEGDLDGALRLLDDALAREPGNERAGTLKGELLWRGKHDEAAAVAALNKTVAASPGAVAAHVALIGIHNGAGRAAEAKAQFEALKKAAPNHPDTLFIEAQQALQAGDARTARDIATRLLRGMPDNPRLQMLAGAADFRLGAYNQAESNLARALRALPQHLPTRQLLAQTYLRTNQPAKALEVLAPTVEQRTADGPTLALAGEAQMMLGDTKRADQMFQAAAKASPNDTRVRTSVALAQYARGETQGALAALETIAAEDNTGTRADMALITARLRGNDIAGALKAVDALQKKMPQSAMPDLLRGRVLLVKKDTAGATAAFEAALKKEPKFVPAATALAQMTADAATTGTATPLPRGLALATKTPTPVVVTSTPTAENAATATVMVARETAIAFTTGVPYALVTATPTPLPTERPLNTATPFAIALTDLTATPTAGPTAAFPGELVGKILFQAAFPNPKATAAGCPSFCPNLGLDLVGGLRGEYQLIATDNQPITPDILAQTRTIIENRVNATGVAEPNVQTAGADRITIELPGAVDRAEIEQLVGSTGRLYFVPIPSAYAASVTVGSGLPPGMDPTPDTEFDDNDLINKIVTYFDENCVTDVP